MNKKWIIAGWEIIPPDGTRFSIKGGRRRSLFSHDGRVWCNAGGVVRRQNGKPRSKQAYETLELAWIAAFLHFCTFGTVVTPYRCTVISTKELVCKVQYNLDPWSTKGWMSKVYLRDRKQRSCCNSWHLSANQRSILPSARP